MDYEFNLPQHVFVRDIFSYFCKQFKGECTMYGGSAAGETIDGNTFLAILGRGDRPHVLERLYHVNPHAGKFNTVHDESTNHVTVSSVRELSPEELEILTEEVCALT